MRAGYYSDKYFVRARDILERDHYNPRVTVQVFGKADAFLGGIDEAIAILKLCSDDWSALDVHALYDGDADRARGKWCSRSRGPTPTSPISRRSTSACSRAAPGSAPTRGAWSTRRRPKEVMFFPARHDHWLVQTGDGYAAHIAGAIGVSTDAQASWWGSEGIGTVPHGLIAAYGGDTVLASQKFLEHMDGVDPAGDAGRFRERLRPHVARTRRGARRRALWRAHRHQRDAGRQVGDSDDGPRQADRRHPATGAATYATRSTRRGIRHVRIVVSGGFTVEKIREFEKLGVPVDAYGVGSSLFQGRFDFTADVVMHEGKPCAKVGREYRPQSATGAGRSDA